MNARPVTIVNKLGLHARAATRLVNCASGFTADVRLVRGARSVNAKSIMGVLTLAAATGAELVVEAEGPDEEAAVEAIATLIDDRFGEVRTVAGVDVGFEQGGSVTRAAVAVLGFPELTPLASAVVRRPTTFPYVPGLLTFREGPGVLRCRHRPDGIRASGASGRKGA